MRLNWFANPGSLQRLLKTACEIVEKGITDPEIFELIGLFEEGFGADRISDMTCSILLHEFCAYTQRVIIECECEKVSEFSFGDVTYKLPFQVVSGKIKPIIICPRDILRNLPVVSEFYDLSDLYGFNSALRNKLNEILGKSWREEFGNSKKFMIKKALLEKPDAIRAVIEAYRASSGNPYNLDIDPDGHVSWYETTKEMAVLYPLALSLDSNASVDDIETTVLKICEHFKELVENNGLCKLFYRDNECTQPKSEDACQLVFFGVASAYCQANNLDLSPESDGGRGPVDFKVSRGFLGKVLVELKKSSNGKLIQGNEKQVKIYEKAEKASKSYMVVIKVTDSDTSIEKLKRLDKACKEQGQKYPIIIVVDGQLHESASKA